MNFIGVDIGASGTRVISQTSRIGILPNNSVELGSDEVNKLLPYDGELENALEVIITKAGESKYFPLHIMYGTMAERYSHINVRPSVQQMKHQQKLSYASLLISAAVSRINFGTPEAITLYVAVPPVEVDKAEEAFKEELIGDFDVTFPKYNGGLTQHIKIVDVKCYEEAYMSMVSYFFALNGAVREEAKPLLKGHVLAINIGASTTDLAIIKNGRYLEKSGKTIPVGGNIARDYLISAVNDKYSFELPIEEAEKVMAEGRLEIGASYVDASDIVSDAKDTLAHDIVSRMEFYFKTIGVPIQTIKAIVVSGGGSMRSQYINADNEVVITSKPMSEFVTKQLEGWCSEIKVEQYGDDARLADLKGLFIKAQVDCAKEEAMKQAQQSKVQAVVSTQQVQVTQQVQNNQTLEQSAQTVEQSVEQVAGQAVAEATTKPIGYTI